MKISELIDVLKEMQTTYGDVDVTVNDECGSVSEVRKDMIYAYNSKAITKIAIDA